MKKLCYIATVPDVIHAFLRAHIQKAAGSYEITIVCNSMNKHLLDNLDAKLVFFPIERKPSFFKDVYVFFQLLFLFRNERFDIVHSIMPKTGILSMMAAWVTRVPVRMHTFTGQVWVLRSGIYRFFFKSFDKLIAVFATCVLADSPSQRDFLVSHKVLEQEKVQVIGSGSICGVDSLRFHPDKNERKIIRHELGIAHESKIILYVGRLNRDKGVLDLAYAFHKVVMHHSDVELIFVGNEEDVTFEYLQGICSSEQNKLHYVPFTSKPERYMKTADIFCLPSYREGFGLTIIEAAACGIPTVASRIYGITDAILDKQTGLLFEAGDVNALTQLLVKFVSDDVLRQNLGSKAYKRVLAEFSSDSVTNEMVMLYDSLSDGL